MNEHVDDNANNHIGTGLDGETLAAALNAGQKIADNTNRIHIVEVDDGGKALRVPVAIVPDTEGAMQAISLLDTIERGTTLARTLRQRDASGPDRREGTAVHQSIASLIAHVNRFKDGDSAIWGDPTKREITAILDYHRQGADGATRWGKHRGLYKSPLSEPWNNWGGEAGLTLTQEQIIKVFDEHDVDLATGNLPNGKAAPEPAALLSIAQKLEVHSSNKVKKEIDKDTGRVRLDISSDEGFVDNVTLPPAFLIDIPVFQDGQKELLEVRLRASAKDGKATFSVKIHDARGVLREAFDGLCARVGNETSLPVFIGSPEGAAQ